MYKHLSCAAFKIKLTTGSGNAGTCEKLHDRSRIWLQKKNRCEQAPYRWYTGLRETDFTEWVDYCDRNGRQVEDDFRLIIEWWFVIVRSESVNPFSSCTRSALRPFLLTGRRAAAALLKQEVLAFIKGVSTLQVLLRELRTALSTRKRRTVVPAGFRGRAPGEGPRTSQRTPSTPGGQAQSQRVGKLGGLNRAGH